MTKLNFVSKGEGRALVFVHGLGESLDSWAEQIDYFSTLGFQVLAIDLRGHGKSEAGPEKIEIKGFSEDILELLKPLSIFKSHFCGLSLGALVILETYKQVPEAFLSMTLVSTLPQYPPAQTQALENMSMSEVGDQVASAAVGPSASVDLKRRIANVIASTSKRVYIESAESACAQDYTSMLPSIKVPVLLVSGELDYITPPESAMFMQKRIVGSKLEKIRGVGHLPNRENPDEFNKVLFNFLKSVDEGLRS